MFRIRLPFIALAVTWACGGGQDNAGAADTTKRDLSLAPAESVSALNDRPVTPPPAPRPQPRAEQPRPRQTQPDRPVTPPPAPARPTLGEGTQVAMFASDTITSRHNKKGEPVTATASADVRDAKGATVIPAGAVFVGTISDIAPAETPGGQGRMVLTFNRVQFGGQSYAVTARVDTVATRMKGRGVTAGDAAKVGAGAVVGAVAGRILGGNKKGTAVGAAVGAAAGTGIAAATRDVDIILDAGALVRITLTAPFELVALE